MWRLTGYQVESLLYNGARSMVYRARRELDDQPCIIKTHADEFPRLSEVERLRREYEIGCALDSPNVVKYLGLEKCGHGVAVIQEDFKGQSLVEIIPEDGLPLDAFFRMALQLVAGLEALHEKHVIHKDIKPRNIVVCPETGVLKYIDFGISTTLAHEDLNHSTSGLIEGTLAYMSPEQTGRMNRGLDYRSDFYSLGITFYQMLCGKVPFEGHEALETVHCHIARKPVPLERVKPGVPIPVSDIVMKLLAKNAEDRYQSGAGLKADLEYCRRRFKETGEIPQFDLGQLDFSSALRIPQKLYGRHKEVATLMKAFSRAAAGQVEILMVNGYSGVGKSSLVNEIQKSIVARQGYFISGKFDQFQQNVPYSGLIEAFRELVNQLLAEPEERLESWRQKLLRALGSNGRVIIDLLRDVELVIGPQPEVPELDGAASRNRLNMVFEDFIRVFAKSGYPLVVFLDDLQWTDPASLDLLRVLLTDLDSHLLFIGAYRDNEVGPDHPLERLLADLRKSGVVYTNLYLTPLPDEAVHELLRDTLGRDTPAVGALAELLLKKTGGNPFFVREFLKALYKDGMLSFDVEDHEWQWDVERIRAHPMTDNVVTLMIAAVTELPEVTQRDLRIASCIGAAFDLRVLATIAETSACELSRHLLPAINEGLIRPVGLAHKHIQTLAAGEERAVVDEEVMLRFSHDRIQQAAYEMIEADQRQAVHLNIGRLLLGGMKEAVDQAESLFAVVSHLNQGRELITEAGERQRLAELNLLAGQRARKALAVEPAVQFFSTGIGLLSEKSWQSQYALAFNLYRECGECHYTIGRTAEGDALFDKLFDSARDDLEKAGLLLTQLNHAMLTSDWQRVVERLTRGLSYCGVSFSDSKEAMAAEIAKEEAILADYSRDKIARDLLALDDMTDPAKIMALGFLSLAANISYLSGWPTMMRLCLCKGMNLMYQYGKAEAGARLSSWYSVSLIGENNYSDGYDFAKYALALVDNYPNCRELPPVYCIAGALALHFREPMGHSVELFEKSAHFSHDVGDTVMHSASLINKVYYVFAMGRQLGYLEEIINEAMKVARKNQVAMVEDAAVVYLDMVQGMSDPADELKPAYHFEDSIWERIQGTNNYAVVLHARFQRAFWTGDYVAAISLAAKAVDYYYLLKGYVHWVEHLLLYSTALLRFQAEARIDQAVIETVEGHLAALEPPARDCKLNFEHKYLLVKAELARVRGAGVSETMALYEGAAKAASKGGFLQYEALANELYGRYWWGLGSSEIGATFLRKAHYLYERWGALARVHLLVREFPAFLGSKSGFGTITAHESYSVSGSPSGSTPESLDFSSVIKVAQALSREINLDRLMSKMIQTMVECAGAQTGFLILITTGTPRVEAAISVEGNEPRVLQGMPIERCENLSEGIVRYVMRSHESVVLHDASETGLFVQDPYVREHKPKSILCTPLKHKDEVEGVLYLENNLATHTFSEDRIRVLHVLLSQAVISLENARLYEETHSLNRSLTQEVAERKRAEDEVRKLNEGLELRVEERTRELREAQERIIAQEKMASLGGLVAGVAHEINTPIGNSVMAASHFKRKMADFNRLYEEGEVTEDDMDAFMEMGASASHIILSNLERASELVSSFKMVAVDQSHADRRPFWLKAYLEQVIYSLRPKLKQTKHRVHLKCRAPEGDVELFSYPGAFSQIITNLIVNSLLHAYDPGEQGDLRVDIATEDERLILTYEDNGRGIPSENLKKIFEPFFTTKRAHGGTGLGLHVIYNVINHQLGGSIHCESVVGAGAKFVIECPLKSAAQAKRSVETSV